MEGPLGLAVGRGRTCSTPEGPTAQPPRHSTTAEAARTQRVRRHIRRIIGPAWPGRRRLGMPVGSRRRAPHGWVGLGPRGSIEDQPQPEGPPAPEPRLLSIGWRRVARGVVAAGKVASELRCAAIPLAAVGRSMPRRVWSGWRPSCLPPSKPATRRRSGRCWPLTPGGGRRCQQALSLPFRGGRHLPPPDLGRRRAEGLRPRGRARGHPLPARRHLARGGGGRGGAWGRFPSLPGEGGEDRGDRAVRPKAPCGGGAGLRAERQKGAGPEVLMAAAAPPATPGCSRLPLSAADFRDRRR